MEPARKFRKRWPMVLGVVVLALIVGRAFCSAIPQQRAQARPIAARKVELGDIARFVVATSKMQPVTQVEVKSKASGIVTQLAAEFTLLGPR